MTDSISNAEDIIDSRDVIARIEELEQLRDAAEEDASEGHAGWGYGKDEREELAALVALRDEAADYAPDWQYGVALIRETYFTEYAQQLAEDIGAISGEERWPACHIDWEAAAESLKQDYTEVDFDGVSYLVR